MLVKPLRQRASLPEPVTEPMTILDANADVVIEDGPVIINEKGELEEPEEVTLDLSALMGAADHGAAAAELDADVGYFDVNGQFVERSPVKSDWSSSRFSVEASAAQDDGVAAVGAAAPMVVVLPDPQLAALSVFDGETQPL
ncbi:uncharacterized protein LOC119114155 [Pollicipes pollicipes]|uniref:uncharacterized protein LOC119114155 n=1 Tax=Pollicipes pollicipes TaxID=41117 RepID=UPI0018853D13|nr:uncharacterized protein LOC119114155 [Pollicipes pollicipes]